MNKVHIIVNPLSARGKTVERWNTIKEVIRHYFNEFKYIFTEKPHQATEIARDLLKDGFDLIIGVGGDGTLNEITNGFFKSHSHKVINEEASLGIIPSGTGSDFVRSLKIPKDFHKSVELIKNSNIKKIDVGKITHTGSDREDIGKGKYFVNIASFGLGAEVVKNVSSIPSGKRGAFSYYKGLLATIGSYRSKNVKIIIDDGREEINGSFLIGAIANGRIFGGGMKIAPGAELDDGYFDLVLVKDMKKFEIIWNSRILYTGAISKHPKVIVKRAKKIKVTSDPIKSGVVDPIKSGVVDPIKSGVFEEVNIEYDGEVGQLLPAEFEIIEKSLNFRF